MKRGMYVVVLILAGLIFTTSVYAAKAKSAIVTTLDVKEAYEVIDIVTYRTSSASLNDVIKGLKKAADKIGADAVVGFRVHDFGGNFYAYGTAVKFEK